MNLLPKNYSDFKEKTYWDSFFKNLKDKQAFQWYGAFQNYRQNIFFTLMQLSQLNNKSKNFTLANIGCGNSTLADDIVSSYPLFNIVIDSFDYSEQVIAQMKAKNNKKQKLTYQVCDLLRPVPAELAEKYDIVFDKGTLDAILPQDKQENIKEIQQMYFENIKNMLKTSTHSSYVIISMLQSFILQTILRNFSNNKHFSIKIHQKWIPDSEVQPFLIQIRRSPQIIQKQSNIQLQLLNKSIINLKDIPSALQQVLKLQKLNSYTKHIQQLRPNQHSTFNVYAQKNQTHQYVVDILDHYDPVILKKNTCSVFIVPQGKQNEEIFSSQAGIRELHSQINSSRLILVKLVGGQKYKDLDFIKGELNPIMTNIIQKNCLAKDVPYITGS